MPGLNDFLGLPAKMLSVSVRFLLHATGEHVVGAAVLRAVGGGAAGFGVSETVSHSTSWISAEWLVPTCIIVGIAVGSILPPATVETPPQALRRLFRRDRVPLGEVVQILAVSDLGFEFDDIVLHLLRAIWREHFGTDLLHALLCREMGIDHIYALPWQLITGVEIPWRDLRRVIEWGRLERVPVAEFDQRYIAWLLQIEVAGVQVRSFYHRLLRGDYENARPSLR
jgi:hypothetical protein